MTDAMEHRGPNDRGLEMGAGIRARRPPPEHRRSSPDGHQPFANEDGTIWGAQNGELYNHDELAFGPNRRGPPVQEPLRHRDPPSPLRAVRRLRSPSDCAGSSQSPSSDSKRRRAVLARDRLGIKPLYYAIVRRPHPVRLGTEVPARQRTRCRWILDYEAVSAYLELGYFAGLPDAVRRRLQAAPRVTVWSPIDRARTGSSSGGSTRCPNQALPPSAFVALRGRGCWRNWTRLSVCGS